MKFISNISKAGLVIMMLFTAFAITSCKDDLPGEMDTSLQFTELKSIKILNTGANGDVVLEGTIDENTKKISFPRIDTLTNFENLKFEAVLSDGAKLEQDAFNIAFEEGKSEKQIVLKVVNAPRYREYLTTLRLKVPVYGADFTKGVIFDFSNNALGNPLYPDYVGASTRGAAFDGEYVMVPSRFGSVNPHLLKVSDLKAGIINKVNLNTTNVTGGTLAVQTGAFVNGNLYVFNVSSAVGFKMYYYENYKENYNKPPLVITVPVGDLPIATTYNTRFGENTSVNLDENGNGYIYMPNNPVQHILRLKISNYTQVVERSVLPLPVSGMTFGMSYNQIGNSSQYLCTSYGVPMYIMTDGGSIVSPIATSVFEASAAGARIIYFNNERYLMYMTAGINSSSVTVFKVYNITRGKTIEEAIGYFAAQSDLDKKPVFEFALNGGSNAAPITYTSWKIEKDNNGKDSKLLLFTAGTDAGFSIFEFPVNVATD